MPGPRSALVELDHRRKSAPCGAGYALRKREASSGAETLARLAHERDRLREQQPDSVADLGRLVLRVALQIEAVDRGDGYVDGELDRVVGPRDLLGALHLLCELGHPAAQLLRVAEEAERVFRGHGPIVRGADTLPRVARSHVDAGGVSLCVEETGAGVPVVLVHGTACDRGL